MSAQEQRKLVLIVGGFIATSIVVVIAIFALDVRSLVQEQLPTVEQAIDESMQDLLPIQEPQLDENGEYIITEDEFKLPHHMIHMGQIERGIKVDGIIGMRRIEGWTIAGKIGETYLLDFDPVDGGFAWEMAVYGPDKMLLALTADSDAGYADFTQLAVTLPVDGTFYVVLRAFGLDGKYALYVQ